MLCRLVVLCKISYCLKTSKYQPLIHILINSWFKIYQSFIVFLCPGLHFFCFGIYKLKDFCNMIEQYVEILS